MHVESFGWRLLVNSVLVVPGSYYEMERHSESLDLEIDPVVLSSTYFVQLFNS